MFGDLSEEACRLKYTMYIKYIFSFRKKLRKLTNATIFTTHQQKEVVYIHQDFLWQYIIITKTATRSRIPPTTPKTIHHTSSPELQ